MDVNQAIAPGRNNAYIYTPTDSVNSTTETQNKLQAPQHTANLNFTHTFSEDLERELTVNVD